MPKYFFTKKHIFIKKLSSQHFSTKNQNESISVTSHFFQVFSYIIWHFSKMDKNKCPKWKNIRQTQNRFFYVFCYDTEKCKNRTIYLIILLIYRNNLGYFLDYFVFTISKFAPTSHGLAHNLYIDIVQRMLRIHALRMRITPRF